MELTVVVPTYNRHLLLKRTLNSLIRAPIPAEMSVRAVVVDNNSQDDTRGTVREYSNLNELAIDYVFEPRQGRSFALNAGIAAADGDLLAMIDDDEEISQYWYAVISSAFKGGDIDFIGGPYLPRWGARPPPWLPQNYLGAIGWVDGGDEVCSYGRGYGGILMGGNAV